MKCRRPSWKVSFSIFSATFALCGCESATPFDEAAGLETDADADAPAWSAPGGGSRTCRATQSQCTDNYDNCFDRCWDSAYSDPGYDCVGVCREAWPCQGGLRGEQCKIFDYAFSGGERLPQLEAACEAAVARDASCGGQTIDPNCELAGRVESSAMAAVYDCVAQTPCDRSPDTCFPAPDAGLANELCAAVVDECDTWKCSSDARAALTHASPWLRAETIEGARACLREPACRNTTECLTSWRAAVFSNYFIFLE